MAYSTDLLKPETGGGAINTTAHRSGSVIPGVWHDTGATGSLPSASTFESLLPNFKIPSPTDITSLANPGSQSTTPTNTTPTSPGNPGGPPPNTSPTSPGNPAGWTGNPVNRIINGIQNWLNPLFQNPATSGFASAVTAANAQIKAGLGVQGGTGTPPAINAQDPTATNPTGTTAGGGGSATGGTSTQDPISEMLALAGALAGNQGQPSQVIGVPTPADTSSTDQSSASTSGGGVKVLVVIGFLAGIGFVVWKFRDKIFKKDEKK